jgi:hypothetical protein
MKDTQNNKYNIIQRSMRDYLFQQIIYNKNVNISDSIRKILEILFRTYFLISERHYPNYNLAQSIINLNLSNLFQNATNAILNENTQFIQNVHSLNYVQTMNFFPNKHNVVNNNSNSNNYNGSVNNGNERNKKYMKVKCHSVSSIVNEDLWLNEHKGRFMKYIKLTNKKRKFNGCRANSQSTYVLPKLGYKCNYSMIIPNFPEDKSDLEKSKIENFKIKEIMDKRKPFPFKY